MAVRSARVDELSSPFRVEDDPASPFSGEVHLLPLRQVLDGRVKRRIRRNGLSEEMNAIASEKKRREKRREEEIDRLRAEVAAKDEEIRQLQQAAGMDDTIVQDTERILGLEQQVAALRHELADRSRVDESPTRLPSHDWTMAARDPYAEDYTVLDPSSDGVTADDEFGDATMADLACSTPSRTVRMRNSFPTPPSTSPTAMPMTPCSLLSTPKSHTGVQVSFPDVQRQGLEEEVVSLQLEICKLTTTLESYSAMASRMSEKLSTGVAATLGSDTQASSGVAIATALNTPHPELEAQLNTLLQTISDRTAALMDLNSSLGDLGFSGSDASEVVASIATAFRTARLELEYLTPGEIALPLTSAGAPILDLILERLRDLARRNKEADDSIDEYHELELSLRKQLGARLDAMDGMSREVRRLEADLKQRDERVAELEVGLDRLKGAVRTYTRDISELEGLVQSVDKDLNTAVSERAQLRKDNLAQQDDLRGRDATIAEKEDAIERLEEKLAAAITRSESLQQQFLAVQQEQDKRDGRHTKQLAELNNNHGAALALRDARVAELRGEIDRVNEALRVAHETVRQLRVDRGALEGRLGEEKRRAKEAIDSMRAELERVVRMGQEFLRTDTPRKKGVQSTGLSMGSRSRQASSGSLDDREDMPKTVIPPENLLEHVARRNSAGTRGEKRRRYDSGLGFLDEEEVDE